MAQTPRHLLHFLSSPWLQRLAGRFAAWGNALLKGRWRNRQYLRSLIWVSIAPVSGQIVLQRDQVATLQRAAAAAVGQLLVQLSSTEQGLTVEQAAQVRRRVGLNEFDTDRPPAWWQHLAECYANPFNLLLTVLAGVAFYTEDWRAATVIATMVVLSVVLRFVQETRSNHAAEALRRRVRNRASVLRPGATAQTSVSEEIAVSELVPGDVIVVAAGDMIPADCRLLLAKDLFVSQSAMTGESLPVEKAVATPEPVPEPFDCPNLLFMGTNVVSGSGHAVVVLTGSRTCFGALAAGTVQEPEGASAFQLGIHQVSRLFLQFTLAMAPLVWLVNGLMKGNWFEATLLALSVAVGVTPEMLPMIVTVTLARGGILLARKKIIVKRLDAIQNFGAMDVLCTDKTGTLTQDEVCLAQHRDVLGGESEQVFRLAYLNSAFQTGLRNLLDHAVLAHADPVSSAQWLAQAHKVDEIPFDFERRRMSVVVCAPDLQTSTHRAGAVLICKGAVDEILSVCTRVEEGGSVQALSPERSKLFQVATAKLHESGFRVVAVAYKELAVDHQGLAVVDDELAVADKELALADQELARGDRTYQVADEAALILAGYVAFYDPPKESTRPALAALAASGVSVKILSGDHEQVVEHICRQVDFVVHGTLLGAEIALLSDAALRERVLECNVFARLNPMQKARLVGALRATGHVVGFLGDGINDAPALRAADLGISVDSAVDIAREAADVILLEKSLVVLNDGVMEGRRIFANMLKYIRMTASSNFGNVFSILLACVLLPFLPMLPLQILVQNLLYDISQIAIPFDQVDADQVASPLHWEPRSIASMMLWFGPASSAFDLMTFAILWFGFSANTLAEQALFQSGWFVEGLISQALVIHLIRTRRIPFLQSRAAWPVFLSTAFVALVCIGLVEGPLNADFGFQSLPLAFYLSVSAVWLAYGLSVQALKTAFLRRHRWV